MMKCSDLPGSIVSGLLRNRVLTMILCIVFMAGFLPDLKAQQRPQYTQYMVNPFLLNPAVAGTEDFTDIRAGYRKQWVGFEGAPRTMFVSAHTNIGKEMVMNNRTRKKRTGFHGIGAVIANDAIGPTSTTVMNLAYSYHLRLNKTLFASLGAMGGLQQYSLDGNKLYAANPGDPLVSSYTNASLADINTGFWLYSDKFYVGGSLVQIMPQRLYSQQDRSISKGRLAQHYFITAGYNIPMGSDFSLIPSIMFKSVAPSPVSFDINTKIRYGDFLWAGISYRNTDAIAIMGGIILNNTFEVSYSYDYTTSAISVASGGSHEVIVGYRLRKRTQLVCPSHFW